MTVIYLGKKNLNGIKWVHKRHYKPSMCYTVCPPTWISSISRFLYFLLSAFVGKYCFTSKVWFMFVGFFICMFYTFKAVLFSRFCYDNHCCCLVGASAGQPLPFSLIGGSSDVIQSQQQRVEFTVSLRTHCRNHTYVLTCVICPQRGSMKVFSHKWRML